jgi:hypothetical protein
MRAMMSVTINGDPTKGESDSYQLLRKIIYGTNSDNIIWKGQRAGFLIGVDMRS